MIQTITDENYVKGTEQKTGLIYSDVKLVSFLTEDGTILVYVNIGEIKSEFIEDIQSEITTYPVLSTRPIKFTQDEIKTLIEATGNDFNGPVTNLLLDEINKYVDDIILNDITNNPANYFGLDVSKWRK